jgi:hypothetical protein
MPSIAYTAIASALFVVGLLVWRVWPVARGRAQPGDSTVRRLEKWNRYLLKLMRKSLNGRVGVAQAGFVTSTAGATRSIATWPMLPTLIPDVEFIALARPDQTPPTIEAVAEAAELRQLLGGAARDQSMWGHQAWLYSWPEELDMDVLVRKLIPIDEFRARYGGQADEQD